MSAGCGCKDCKRVREHVASLLPFKVLEAAAGKPLRISGVALAAGMSRNFNVYTPEELMSFAPQLVGAPVYIEHVSAASAIGKATKCFYDAATRCVMYEAEIFDPVIAEKIRNGLIQHVSVGVDYVAIDLVDAKIPRGLYNPELSLVAVPGIPEANIQVLEHLRESLVANQGHKLKLPLKEILSPLDSTSLTCVFCGAPGEYLVSTCITCGDRAANISSSQVNGVEKLEEKDLDVFLAKVAEKISLRDSAELQKTKESLTATEKLLEEKKVKLTDAESQVSAITNNLAEANKTIEALRKQLPGGGLLKDPPKMMLVSEHVAVLEGLLSAPMVERSTPGMKRKHEEIRSAIFKASAQLKGAS